MIQLRKSAERGHVNHGWLEAYHTFSFSSYQDPRFQGFRSLLVINEDRIQPGEGFGKHPHEDMEIITYIVEGALAHEDSTGTSSVIRAGDVQRMSAGRGVEHSEFNHSQSERVHLLQIWITPEKAGIDPGYEEKRFSAEAKRNRLLPIVTPTGESGSLHIHQRASVFASVLEAGQELSHELARGRYGWLQLIRGGLSLGELKLDAGDGAAISEERVLKIRGREGKTAAEFLLFDLP